MSQIEIVSVNVSEEKGTVKRPMGQAVIGLEGISGDAHAGPWHRQVSLLSQETIDRFAQQAGRQIGPGEFAENLTVRGLDTSLVAPLDRFRFGAGAAREGGVELEVTQIGKECHGDGCTVFRQVGKCVMPAEGIFARVLRGGPIESGQKGEFLPRRLRFLILTLSDRAAAGVYEDRSGPRIRQLLDAWLAGKRWHAQFESVLLPDSAERLREQLAGAVASGVDVIFTTGGTGVGPRDITPETAASLCDKQIPGIMEHIRLKFGGQKPQCLLSRSIAGVARATQIYTLPGSVRAVEEYLGEILKTVEHLLLMIHGLDVH